MTIPLFPLPDAVFFPHTFLPLHVFEPRYKAMVRDALDGNRLIGIGQLRPGWSENYFESPSVFKFLGVGEIEEVDRWPDGRFDIILSGLHRSKIIQEIDGNPYRMAEVAILDDLTPEDRIGEINDIHELLLQIFYKLSAVLPENTSILPGTDVRTLTPGMLTDVMAGLLVNDPYERQCLLAEVDVSRRQQLLRVHIQTMFNPNLQEE